MSRNPDSMSTEELILEVNSLQDEIRVRALRAHELGSSLYRRTRRSPTDDSTAVYMTYANAIVRFAGAINQVSSRTVRTAKVLDRLPKKVEETAEQRKPLRKAEQSNPTSPVEDLINLYVNNAIVEAMVPDTGETNG